MNRSLEWISLGAAFAALIFDIAIPSSVGHGLVLAAIALSLILATTEIVLAPKRALLLLGFLPSLPLAFSAVSLYGLGNTPLVAVLLALQLRLLLLRWVERGRQRNLAFASDLKASLPEKALVFVDIDIEGEAPLSSIIEGHLIRIRPGDMIPADGQITFGSSFVDESPLTGEREPKTKSMGSYVYAGSRNKNGSFIFRVNTPPSSSMAMLLASALERGFPFSALLSRPFFFLESITIAAAMAYAYVGDGSILTVLNVFLVSSGLWFAAAIWAREYSFIAQSSAGGIVWKDNKSIQQIAKTGTTVSTATGVVTEGRAKVSAVEGTKSLTEDGALRLVGPLARKLENEFSFALLQELQSRNIRLELVDDFQTGPSGTVGIVDGQEVRWMNIETARLEGIPLASLASFTEARIMAGETVQVLVQDGVAVAAFAFRDPVTDQAVEGITLLAKMGIPFLLVAPDTALAIRRLQDELGLRHAHPDCDEADAELLLENMAKEGLRPLWIANSLWRIHHSLTVVPVIPGLNSIGLAQTLRRDLASIARFIGLAKAYAKGSKVFLFWAVISQICLLPFLGQMDPRLAAFFGIAPGLLLGSYARLPLSRRT